MDKREAKGDCVNILEQGKIYKQNVAKALAFVKLGEFDKAEEAVKDNLPCDRRFVEGRIARAKAEHSTP